MQNFLGPVIGLATFIIIGIFHPLVIKGEYYWGQKVNYVFLVVGIVAVIAAFAINNIFWSAIVSVIGFSSFWSIGEVKAQKKRVERGWFPKNPKRK